MFIKFLSVLENDCIKWMFTDILKKKSLMKMTDIWSWLDFSVKLTEEGTHTNETHFLHPISNILWHVYIFFPFLITSVYKTSRIVLSIQYFFNKCVLHWLNQGKLSLLLYLGVKNFPILHFITLIWVCDHALLSGYNIPI